MASFLLFKDLLVGYLMPEKCYEEIFVHFHFHVPCLRFVLNKVAGFWILLDTFLAQLPQLLRILWRGSSEGLSLTSVLLQLYALSCPVVYAVANSFPFFSWAERLFILAQTATIIFLILHHRGETFKGLLLLLGFSNVMLLLGLYASGAVVSLMMASSGAALIASKVAQAVTNYHNGHTGQLSTLSLFLTWMGSLSIAVVCLQESGGSLASLSHVLSSCLSFVLLSQVFSYTCSSATAAKKTD
ncbi:mannose-P-dolichol utilization defect 1 protein-like [Kryptolebias marmoratus]|uniref:Mannose-P-dolichol utilization defect 1a n=1 Tax=Kryptolebias marmoratus TaxID=37003 RepID=A0A3Q3A394_KRYMA|nr:mannose-P-dolichol utilization defect 1 protein-like [Kryptolebias marmoratus]XP_024865304.1 mannose-P-dolichol utilization defect 1 protein-like [Kryptolebias marmoratus]